MSKMDILEKIKGKLIVSCQALPDEPLHSSFIMARMAYAAMLGGAGGIRANSVEDITEIKKTVNLPIIGICKVDYEGCEVYITPTMKEVDDLVSCGVDIIAMDATDRPRPDGRSAEDFFLEAKAKYPEQLFMADCSCTEEGLKAAACGFDLVGTTMSGYTSYTKGTKLPNFEMMEKLVKETKVPVIAEGGIWCPEDLKRAMSTGVHAAVVGSVITRPMLITKRYVEAISMQQ